jgi:hypothetical protein
MTRRRVSRVPAGCPGDDRQPGERDLPSASVADVLADALRRGAAGHGASQIEARSG